MPWRVKHVLVTCVLRCVVERHDAKSQDHCSKKQPLAATQALSLRTQALPIFSKIQRLLCPRLVIHAGQKCPQFFGIGRSWMLNELCLELVPPRNCSGNACNCTTKEWREDRLQSGMELREDWPRNSEMCVLLEKSLSSLRQVAATSMFNAVRCSFFRATKSECKGEKPHISHISLASLLCAPLS